MIAQIQVRRGTTAEWAAASPVVLEAGESGYDTTLKKTKIGDGVTEWASLPWQNTLGNITSDGKVGTVADKTLMTGAGGLVVARTMAEAIAIWGLKKDNLLHNWDFRNPVNQRKVSGVITGNAYFYDRWRKAAGTSITIATNYITVTNDIAISQRLEGNHLGGKVVTLSVGLDNGTIYTGTGVVPETDAVSSDITITGWGTYRLGNYISLGYTDIRIASVTASNVQAVKLELGTVSTLAYDPPMDHAVELPKCQRFFVNLGYHPYFYGWTSGTTSGGVQIYLPVEMRILPTWNVETAVIRYGGTLYNVTPAINLINASAIKISVTGTGLTASQAFSGYFNDLPDVWISADL